MRCQEAQAKYVYDQFRVSQPHIKEDGVWALNDTSFAILCPDLTPDLKALSGEPLIEWFQGKGRPMCFNIKLAKDVSPQAKRLEPRTLDQIAFHHGAPTTLNGLIYQLYLYLPKDFPDFIFSEMPLKITLLTEVDLTAEQSRILYETAERLGFSFQLDHKKEPGCLSRLKRGAYKTQPMTLMPSRKLNETQASTALKALYQADEELWLDNKAKVLTRNQSGTSFLNESWSDLRDSCLVSSSAFLPDDVRTYLSINEKIVYEMPLSGSPTEFLKASGVTEAELLSLYEMGRVNFVLPQSIERYPLSLLERLIEINPSQILMPRRLTLQNITEMQGRVPLLMPPMDFSGKKILLESAFQVQSKFQDENVRNILKLFITELSRIWLELEHRLDTEGPLTSSTVGLGFLVGGLYNIVSGRDLDLEFSTAATGVEWACSLRTNLVPASSHGFSNEGHSGILLSFYDGVPLRAPGLQDRTKIVAEGLLGVSGHVPVLEFAKVVSEGDLLRLRRLVFDGARSSLSTEDLKGRVADLNREIKSYENNEGFLRKIDLVGLGMDLIPKPPGAGWFFNMVEPFLEQKRRQHPIYGSIMDTLKGMRTFDNPHRPFIARLRENLRRKIQ